MTRFRHLVCALALALVLAPAAASAQGGPPPHVRRAVDATMDMLAGGDDASITDFVAEFMAPAPDRNVAVTTENLRAARAAVRGRLEDIAVERAPDGVLINASGPQGSAQVHVGITEAGVTSVSILDNGGSAASQDVAPSGALGTAGQQSLRALEGLPHQSLDEAVRTFEREQFSAAFMARTAPSERRALLERLRTAVADAGGLLADHRDGAFVLGLRGGSQDQDVVVRLQASAPFRIEAIDIQAVQSINIAPEDLAATFERLEANGFSGVVHVRRNGETLLERAYGVANPELGTRMQMDTVFGIGSTPITFTQAAIELLEQRGQIDQDAPISRYFERVPRAMRTITIRQLMTGRSGLPDFFHTSADWNPDLQWIDRDEAVRRIFAQTLLFQPGASRQHSHAAFVLLAALIERVSGESYYQFLRQNFLDPAGMTRTGEYGEIRGLQIRDFAVGPGPNHVGVPNIPVNWGPTSWLIKGSGGMYSTLGDMLRYYDFLRTSGVVESSRAAKFSGAGVDVGGSDQGFYIFHAYNGGPDNTVMLLVNMEGRSPEMTQLTRGLEQLIMPTR